MPPDNDLLFQGTLPCKLLKNVVNATKTTNPVLTLAFGGDDQNPVRFWSQEAGKKHAVCGGIDASAFTDLDADPDASLTIHVPCKTLGDTLGMLKAGVKDKVTVEVQEDSKGDLSLVLKQSVKESTERVALEIVEAPDTDVPYDEDMQNRGINLPDRASAMVDVNMLTRFLSSKRTSTASVIFGIGPNHITVHTENRDGQNEWRHPSAVTDGVARATLDTKLFHAVVNGAKQLASNAEVFILRAMVRVEVFDDVCSAAYYLSHADPAL